MLGWLLLFIITGGLFYKYRRTDINQNGEEPSSPSSSSVVSNVVIVVAILVFLVIFMAAILYAWIEPLPGYPKSPPYATLMVFDGDDEWDVQIIKMSPTVSITSVHWYLLDDSNRTKTEGMVSDIYGYKEGEGKSVIYIDNDFDAKVSPGDKFVFYPGEGESNSSYSLADVTSLNDYSFRLKFDPTGDVIGDVPLRPE